MKICIPVEGDQGLDSVVCAHFGSAPVFLIVDSDSSACRAVENRNQHHGHGMCMPLASLQGEELDAMVVGGIGMGALNKLRAAGIRVYLAEQDTAGEVVKALSAGTLKEVDPGQACAHHRHGQG